MYAVIETSGRQYRVELDSEIELDHLDADPGSTIELGRVLLVADGDDAHIGQPVVDGARVTGEVLRQDRGDKVVVFKYRPKARRRVKKGHRADLTVVRVSDIVLNGRSAANEAKAQAKEDAAARAAAEKEAARQAAADQALADKLAAERAAQDKKAADQKAADKKAADKKAADKKAADSKPADTEPAAKKSAADKKSDDEKAATEAAPTKASGSAKSEQKPKASRASAKATDTKKDE